MYECPNCGGNLKFDIASQMLKCDYCLTTADPYVITKDRDAEENSDFDVTVFTCPQCGGEILSTDTSAAEFCSFCGASTILDSRISKEYRPAHIIPFKQTKDDCKKAYISRMKRAVFAPDELKSEKHIDSFRGIYMPYWSYHISQKGTVSLKGQKSFRKGDYIYTDHYSLSGKIDAEYKDLSYDASSSFADNISEKIAPFDVKDQVDFTPSFLSGFYADTADVGSYPYKEDVLKLANTTSYNQLKKDAAFSGISFSSKNTENLSQSLCTEYHPPKRVMYPVWFMSYRKGDRVAYATVNGQTGKVAADIPVDIKKYILGSLLTSIPIFILLNFLFTIRPGTALFYSILLSVASFIIYWSEIIKIIHKDQRDDDRGYLFLHTQNDSDDAKENKKVLNSITLSTLWTYSFWSKKCKIPGFIGSFIAILAALLIFICNPISDIWYYSGTIIAFLGILFTIMAIIQKYNILATRRLPQFNRKGGNDNA